MNGAWEIGETSAVVDTPYAYASALSENDVPHQGCLAFDFTFSEGTERFAVALQVDEEFARGYYFYLDPKQAASGVQERTYCMSRADGRSSTMSSWSGRWN